MDGFLILKVLTETFGGVVRYVFTNLFLKIIGENTKGLKYYLKESGGSIKNTGYLNGFIGTVTFLLVLFLIFLVI